MNSRVHSKCSWVHSGCWPVPFTKYDISVRTRRRLSVKRVGGILDWVTPCLLGGSSKFSIHFHMVFAIRGDILHAFFFLQYSYSLVPACIHFHMVLADRGAFSMLLYVQEQIESDTLHTFQRGVRVAMRQLACILWGIRIPVGHLAFMFTCGAN